MYRFRDTLPIDISEQTISGDLVTIDNSEEMGVIDSLSVSLSPIQDLNGYDKPWVGGAGKNKLPNATASQTINGVTFTANANGTVKINGTATASADFYFVGSARVYANAGIPTGDYILTGSPSDASTCSLFVVRDDGTILAQQYDNTPKTISIDSSRTYRIFARTASGGSPSNVILSPMIRLASVSDATYEPYENICPISGWDSVKVTRSGKNLLPPQTGDYNYGGITWTLHDDGSMVVKGTATANSIRDFGRGALRLKAGTYTAKTSSDNVVWAVWRSSSPATLIKNGVGTFTINEDTDVFVRAYVANGTTVDTTIYPQLELGTTATAYEPYNGNTYTTALGRTVYGGTLDVVSGVLTVDRAMVDLSQQSWLYRSTWASWYTNYIADVKGTNTGAETPNFISDRFEAIATNYGLDPQAQVYTGITSTTRGASGCRILVKNGSTTESPTGQLAYELATPQTYQLTPQQIELLLGENHVWSDGEISVVWHKDLTKGRILPTEAVSINGQYIENVLDGYRTLYTKGRESLGAELNTYSVGTADGEKFKNKRYPARELTVGFRLIADNAEDFREKFNNLNNLLSLDEADFIFHDEEDKFFSGYPIMNAEVEAGENSVKGEWKIYCAYPFKRSVDPITLTMADATVTNTTATFTIDYKGSQPARPVLRAKFAGAKSGGTSSEDGDCGFVAFMDARENIIQLGNPDVLDLDAYAKAGNLINYEFINTSGWTMTGGHRYKGTVTGTVAVSDAVDAFWDGGTGQTQSYAKPSYGSGTGLHGSILWKNTAGASNFTLSAVHRLCVNNSNEVGVFELGAYNHSTGKMTAGFVIDKNGNGTTGTVRYIVNAKQVGTDQIDLSYYNTHFGYCNRTPVYVTQKYKKKTWVKVKVKVRRNKYKTKSKVKWVTKTRKVLKKYNYTQSNLNSSIKKDGINVYFQVGNLPRRTFNVPEIEQIVSHDASCYMGTYGTEMNTNMIHSMMFRKETGAVFAEQPNVFTAGDIVEADCNEATVNIYRAGSIGGHLEPQYGALGNDWESFKLTSGENIIRATWSDWVNPTYKPQIEIEYNEVFI